MGINIYDKLAYEKRYSLVYKRGARHWEEPIPTEDLIRFINERKYSPKIRVIELGCGEGRDAIYLAKRGYYVIAIDISLSAIMHAKRRAYGERVYVNFIVGDVTQLEFIREEFFDLAIDIGCLHMIVNEKDRKKYLENVFRILKREDIYFCCNLGKEHEVKLEDIIRRYSTSRDLVLRKIKTINGREKVIMLPIIPAWPKSKRQYKEELTSIGFKIMKMYLKEVKPVGECCVIIAKKP